MVDFRDAIRLASDPSGKRSVCFHRVETRRRKTDKQNTMDRDVEPPEDVQPPVDTVETGMRDRSSTQDQADSATQDLDPTRLSLDSNEASDRSIAETLQRDKYMLERELGRGSMGQVLAAQDLFLERRVAIKRPLKSRHHAEHQRSLLEEARILSQLEHPNLPTVYSLERDDEGRPFYSMRYEGDRSLATVMQQLHVGDPAASDFESVTMKLDIFQGLLQALIYAHEKGMLHRDIKPANIMLGPQGEVKLIDWGIAQKMDSETESNEDVSTTNSRFVGTPRYGAPEQVDPSRGPVDELTDLYAAFVTLFELLTLQPYITPSTSIAELFERVKSKQPPSVDDVCFSLHSGQPVSKELRYFLQRGLASDRVNRFGSAKEALSELRRLRNGDFSVLCIVTAIKKLLRQIDRLLDRYPRLTSLLLIGAFGFLIFGTIFGIGKWLG